MDNIKDLSLTKMMTHHTVTLMVKAIGGEFYICVITDSSPESVEAGITTLEDQYNIRREDCEVTVRQPYRWVLH